MRRSSSLWLLLLALLSVQAAASGRLADIQLRGRLNCGIWPHVPGFAVEREGRYAGFEVDFCRAVAIAVLGDATRVAFVPVAHVSQFAAREDIDLAIRRLTRSTDREAASGMVFGPVIYHDGQGFLVARGSGITSSSQLTGERICVINQERHPQTIHRHFREQGHDIPLLLVESDQDAERALLDGRCRAYSADISWLAAARVGFTDGLTRYEILPERISHEPLAPLLRATDTELLQVVRWTVWAMIEAEELGVGAHNIDSLQSPSLSVRTLLGAHPGSQVALPAGDWVRAIIAGVGNYGELYERNLGKGAAIGLERGINRLSSQGGLIRAPALELELELEPEPELQRRD